MDTSRGGGRRRAVEIPWSPTTTLWVVAMLAVIPSLAGPTAPSPRAEGAPLPAATASVHPRLVPAATPHLPGPPGSPHLTYCNGTGGLPQSPLNGDYNDSTTCTLVSSYTVGSGELSFWSPTELYANATPLSNGTLTLFVSAGSTLLFGDQQPPTSEGHDAVLDVVNGTSLRLVVMGTLEVAGGAGIWLSSTSTLLLGPTGRIVLYGGQLFTPPGALVQLKGGQLVLDGGACWSGADPSPRVGVEAAGRVEQLRLGGSVSSLQDVGTPIENFTLGVVGNLSVAESTVNNLNVSASATSLAFTGFFSRPEEVSNVTVQQVGTFRADDADLADVQITSAGTVLLGNATTSPDLVLVDGFTVGTSVNSLSIAHATVSQLGISTATRVFVENSTFSSGASVTQAAQSFTANGTSRFAFPLVFNNAPRVNLTNVTSPEIIVDGTANVTVNNWPSPTTLSATSPTSGSLPSISVAQASVAVHVNRYLIVSVSAPGALTLPADTRVTVCNSVVATLCAAGLVNSHGDLGLFVPTDVVTLAGDQYEGTYQVTVSSPAYTTQQTTVQVTSDDQKVAFTLSSPVVPPQLVPVFAAELTGAAVVVGAIVYLRTLTHRVRRPRKIVKSSAGEKSEGSATGASENGTEKPGETAATPRRLRGPAREWRAPSSRSSSPAKPGAANGPTTAGPSADREPGQEARRGDQ